MDRLAPAPPLATVAIASYNSSAFLREAVASALVQSLADLEVIIVDDASTDASLDVALEIARADTKVRVERLPENLGPGAARNRALELARGRWFAVFDSDDLMHPDRLRRLIDYADSRSLDIVADDLVIFSSDGQGPLHRFLPRRWRDGARPLTLEGLLYSSRLFGRSANLGYLKPLYRMSAVRSAGVSYDPGLRVGEDEDFLRRLLQAGLKGELTPAPTYFYRRHSQSISHRLTPNSVLAMRLRESAFEAGLRTPGPALARALLARRRANHRAFSFVSAVEALKARRIGAAAGLLARRPSALWLFHLPVQARVVRLLRTPAGLGQGSARSNVVNLISGREAPRPELGVPVVRLKDRLQAAGLRLARVQVFEGSLKPWNASSAGQVSSSPLHRPPAGEPPARRRGPGARASRGRPAYPDLVTTANRLLRGTPAGLVLQGVGALQVLPYLLPRRPPTLVVRARPPLFQEVEPERSSRGLGAAPQISKTQDAEPKYATPEEVATWIRSGEPRSRSRTPHAGSDELIGFDGPNRAVEVMALHWFLKHVWPEIRIGRPSVRLLISGTIVRTVGQNLPEGVEPAVDAPAAWPGSADLGVVVAPQFLGSVEAARLEPLLTAGRAVVTSTLDAAAASRFAGAVVATIGPAEMARAVLDLLTEPSRRLELSARALAALAEGPFASDASVRLDRWLQAAQDAIHAVDPTAGSFQAASAQARSLDAQSG